MATDLAEFIGGAIGLSLLLHIPMMVGMAIVALLTLGILHVERWGFRPSSSSSAPSSRPSAFAISSSCVIAPVDWGAGRPRRGDAVLPDAAALTLAVGIIGATVMPHAIFLHSGLTSVRGAARNDGERRMLLRFSNLEVIVALTAAGLVNMAMVIMAASAFHAGHSDVAEIETAYSTLTPILGAGAAAVFLTSLLASGVSSSAVGTMAGQMMMQGFVGFKIPVLLRRLVTDDPGLRRRRPRGQRDRRARLFAGRAEPRLAGPDDRADPLHRPARHHGRFRQLAASPRPRRSLGSIVILALNVVLVLQTFGVPIPGLPAS